MLFRSRKPWPRPRLCPAAPIRTAWPPTTTPLPTPLGKAKRARTCPPASWPDWPGCSPPWKAATPATKSRQTPLRQGKAARSSRKRKNKRAPKNFLTSPTNYDSMIGHGFLPWVNVVLEQARYDGGAGNALAIVLTRLKRANRKSLRSSVSTIYYISHLICKEV